MSGGRKISIRKSRQQQKSSASERKGGNCCKPKPEPCPPSPKPEPCPPKPEPCPPKEKCHIEYQLVSQGEAKNDLAATFGLSTSQVIATDKKCNEIPYGECQTIEFDKEYVNQKHIVLSEDKKGNEQIEIVHPFEVENSGYRILEEGIYGISAQIRLFLLTLGKSKCNLLYLQNLARVSVSVVKQSPPIIDDNGCEIIEAPVALSTQSTVFQRDNNVDDEVPAINDTLGLNFNFQVETGEGENQVAVGDLITVQVILETPPEACDLDYYLSQVSGEKQSSCNDNKAASTLLSVRRLSVQDKIREICVCDPRVCKKK
jgi:hypothetical protein